MNFGRTGWTIFSPIGAWIESRSTQTAGLVGCSMKKRRLQIPVQRQDRRPEVFADQRLGNALDADVRIPSIVQQQAIPVVVVAALMYQLLNPAKLLVVQAR